MGPRILGKKTPKLKLFGVGAGIRRRPGPDGHRPTIARGRCPQGCGGGAARVETRHLEIARVLCLKPHRVLLKIILPTALPAIMTGLRLGLIYAWLATIGAEYLFTTTTGIGSMMMDARDLFRMDLVILGMAVIGGIGFALNLILSRLGRLSLWRGVEEML